MDRSAPASPRGSRRSRRLGLSLAALLVGAVAAGAGVTAVFGAGDAPPAVVDGVAVTRDELAFHMGRVRPAVENELDRQRAAGADVDDEAHAEALRTAALDELRSDRTVFRLARDVGLEAPVDFASFERSLSGVNQTRGADLAGGEVVYGLTSFDASEYWSKLLADVREELTRAAVGEGGAGTASGSSAASLSSLQVDDAEVLAAYRADPSRWSAETSVLHTTRLAVPTDGQAAPAVGTSLDAAVFDLAAATSPGATVAQVVVDPGREAAEGPTVSPAVLAQLQSGSPGTVTDVTTEAGAWVWYRLDSFDVDEAAAIERYGTRIRSVLVDERLTDLLHRLTSRQHLQIDERIWQGLDPKELDR